MSRLSNLKKPELVSLANELGVSSDGVKSELEGRIAAFLADNPSVAEHNQQYAAYASPVKQRRKSKKLDSVKHSPEKDEDDGEPSDDGSTETSTVFDKSKEFATSALDSANDVYSHVIELVADFSDSARHSLSSVCTVSFLLTTIELALLLSTIVPVSRKTFIGYILPLPHLEIVSYWKTFWLPLFVWIFASVLVPLVTSYYFNFTGAASAGHTSKRRASKVFRHDPFVYNGTRLAVGLFFYPIFAYYPLDLQICPEFTNAITKGALLVNDALGSYSKFAGIVSILITLYAAAV